MLSWESYPTISEIEGEEIVLEKPERREVIKTVEGLREDEYLVLQDYEVLPYNQRKQKRYGSAEFMKWGPELKIRVVDKPARIHIEKELKRYDFGRPKRGYKWTNPKNRTSVFVSQTNLIDGAKIFAYSIRGDIERIETGKPFKTTWAKVPSRRAEEKHNVIFNPIPEQDGRDWYNFQAFCDCGENLYYGRTSKKFVNPENYVCPHKIAGYHKLMKKFDETKEGSPVPALFPVPTEEKIKFDENLAKTFVKENYRRRLKKGERELLHSLREGLRKNGFSFRPEYNWIEELK